MTNDEIIRLAIKKAKDNGFSFDIEERYNHNFNYLYEDNLLKHKKLLNIQVDNVTATSIGLESVIFSHDFVKAFWGEQEHEYIDNGKSVDICKYCTAYSEEYIEAVGKFCWQEHLSNMVLQEEPLKYLEQYL